MLKSLSVSYSRLFSYISSYRYAYTLILARRVFTTDILLRSTKGMIWISGIWLSGHYPLLIDITLRRRYHWPYSIVTNLRPKGGIA